jgi:hypothetical protein
MWYDSKSRSFMFINYTTIPLKRGPSSFCVWYTRRSMVAIATEAIIYTITHKRSRSTKKCWSAEALHFDSEGSKDQKSGGLPLFIWTVVPWWNTANSIIVKNFKGKRHYKKIFNPQAELQKHPILTLESSKHPLNLVRLSL